MTLREATKEFQRRLILQTLDRTGGNRSQAAKILGMKRYDHLSQRMKRLGIAGPGKRGRPSGESFCYSRRVSNENAETVERLLAIAERAHRGKHGR